MNGITNVRNRILAGFVLFLYQEKNRSKQINKTVHVLCQFQAKAGRKKRVTHIPLDRNMRGRREGEKQTNERVNEQTKRMKE